jgi:hypothetical protein
LRNLFQAFRKVNLYCPCDIDSKTCLGELNACPFPQGLRVYLKYLKFRFEETVHSLEFVDRLTANQNNDGGRKFTIARIRQTKAKRETGEPYAACKSSKVCLLIRKNWMSLQVDPRVAKMSIKWFMPSHRLGRPNSAPRGTRV